MGVILKAQGMPVEKARQRRLGIAQRNVHGSAMRLVRDQFPDHWERVRKCRYDGVARVDIADFTKATYKPYTCKHVPYCPLCTDSRNHLNAWETMKKFYRLRPHQKPLRALHVVMTAPTDKTGHEAWGWRARNDLPRFRLWGIKMLQYMFGAGVSGVINYQDFGNKPFAKPHPHLDCVINGYRLVDGEVRRVEQPQLMVGGGEKLRAKSKEIANDLLFDARGASDIDISPPNWLDDPGNTYSVVYYSNRDFSTSPTSSTGPRPARSAGRRTTRMSSTGPRILRTSTASGTTTMHGTGPNATYGSAPPMRSGPRSRR